MRKRLFFVRIRCEKSPSLKRAVRKRESSMERKFGSMGRVRSREVLLEGAIPAIRTKGGVERAGAGVEAKRKRTA
jgi:hypothetical protein